MIIFVIQNGSVKIVISFLIDKVDIKIFPLKRSPLVILQHDFCDLKS